MERRMLWVAWVIVGLIGCGQQGETPAPGAGVGQQSTVPEQTSPWQELAPGALTVTQQAQRDAGMAAKESFMGELLSELEAALDQDGGPGAIEVCRTRAPMVAAHVGAEHGLRIGRTALRLRNPDNTPPAWATGLVEARVETPVFLAGPAGELAALLPIRLKADCVMCHGSEQAIPEDIATILAELYPGDQATGFAEGDLRGWLWFEVPPPGV